MPAVSILDTGVANIASVRAAFERLDVPTLIVSSPADAVSAEALVLPGVGAFGTAIDRLDALGLTGPLRDRVNADRPTLAICLGMQLLGASSAESPGSEGLGVFDIRVERLEGPRRTHFGWSSIDAPAGALVTPGYAYFAHSFAMRSAPGAWTPTFASFGARFVASLERGNVLACQFHPELSGAWGASILARWLRQVSTPEEVATCKR